MKTPTDTLRAQGTDHELNFWRDFVNSSRFLNNWVLSRPNPELESDIDTIIDLLGAQRSAHGRALQILDLGSGPISILSRPQERKEYHIVATDPLGDYYDKLWDHPSKSSLPTPLPIEGEALDVHFEPESFDVTHIRNAIDHSRDPILVYQQMLTATKRGGLVIVHGFENEAVAENYEGFHQWNICLESESLILRGKDTSSINMDSHFAKQLKTFKAYKKELTTGKHWITHIAVRR